MAISTRFRQLRHPPQNGSGFPGSQGYRIISGNCGGPTDGLVAPLLAAAHTWTETNKAMHKSQSTVAFTHSSHLCNIIFKGRAGTSDSVAKGRVRRQLARCNIAVNLGSSAMLRALASICMSSAICVTHRISTRAAAARQCGIKCHVPDRPEIGLNCSYSGMEIIYYPDLYCGVL